MKLLKQIGQIKPLLIAVLSIQLLVVACQSEYTRLVENELDSGVKNDSLLYGLKFGQTQKEFFGICWKLNEKGIATHGPSNNYVQTILESKDSVKSVEKIRLLFYAKFNPENRITGMDMKFSYVAWSPWNDKFKSDKLLPVVQDTLMKWYPGNPFIKVKNNLVKVDGNRQIELKRSSERDVSVLIENLEYKYNQLVKK